MQADNPVAGAPLYADLLEFYKALIHPVRLRIAGRLAAGACTLLGLARELDEPLASLPRHLAVLTAARLVVDRGSGTFELDHERLRQLAEAVPASARSRALAEAHDERGRVLASFMRDGRIVTWPAGEQRKHVLLQEVASRFAADRTYTEREVNALISPIYDDYTTIRRALVDYHYMNRDRGVYWLGASHRRSVDDNGTQEAG